MVFGVLGQTDIHGVKNITEAITEALSELGNQSDVSYILTTCVTCSVTLSQTTNFRLFQIERVCR